MGNGNPVGVVETGVSFKDLRNPSKDTQDSDMDEDKVKLEKYERQKFDTHAMFVYSIKVSISLLGKNYNFECCPLADFAVDFNSCSWKNKFLVLT